MVKNSLLSYLRRECSCNLDNNDIYNVELDCRSGYRVYIELFINYTSEDGEISASTLAQMLSGQTPQTDLRFNFAGSSASIVSTCNEPICTTVPPDSTTSTVSPRPPFTCLLPTPYFIGVLVAVFLGGALVSAAMIISCYLLVMRYPFEFF